MNWKNCTKCICRGGYDAFNEDRGPCEHWIRWSCTKSEDGNFCHKCTGQVAKCENFKVNSEQIKECLEAVTQVFDDGTIWCPLVEPFGCEECYKRFEERESEE